jgi:hypothetical protein
VSELPVVVLACPVLRDLIEPRLANPEVPEIYLDWGLHVFPKRMAPALQEQLDALPLPHTVLLGYGLCGTGLVGLRAGPHTLVIPRTDDCIAILLGSHERYVRAQNERPGTYYLTRGWLESDNHPLGHHRGFVESFGDEAANHVIDTMYQHYTALRYVAASEQELAQCGPRAREVAAFCAKRWGMTYEQEVASAELVERLLAAPKSPGELGDDFVVIPPGGTVETEMFLRL